jgi:hypothetical protein
MAQVGDGLMRLPKYGHEIVIARDLYSNAIMIHGKYENGHYDLQTDGRVALTPRLARDLAKKLLEFSKEIECR